MLKEDIEKELLKRRLRKMQDLNECKGFSINEDELKLTLGMAIEKTLKDNGLLD
jgi:hypothetical protein